MLKPRVVGVSLALALASAFAVAAPFQLSFEVEREVPRGVGGGGIPLSSLPTTTYRIQVDLTQAARILFLDGSEFKSSGDAASGLLFDVDQVDNHLSSSDAPQDNEWRYGQFANGARQTSWGTGPTYGTFDYTSRVDLIGGAYNDAVYIHGLWAETFALNHVEDLLRPGAVWIVTDYRTTAGGYTSDGSWFARLAGIEKVGLIPTPATSYLVLAALLAAGITRWGPGNGRMRQSLGRPSYRGTEPRTGNGSTAMRLGRAQD